MIFFSSRSWNLEDLQPTPLLLKYLQSYDMGPNISANSHQLLFSRAAINLLKQLNKDNEDIDQIRYHIGPVTLHLFSALRYSVIGALYQPGQPASTYEEDPKTTQSRAEDQVMAILYQLAYPGGSTIEKTAYIMETVDQLVDNLIKLGKYDNYSQLIGYSYEYDKHWRHLFCQRAEIIQENHHLRYHLIKRSIFPLKYIIHKDHNSEVYQLMQCLDISVDPTVGYTLIEICGIIQYGIQEKLKTEKKVTAINSTRNSIRRLLKTNPAYLEFNSLESYLPLFSQVLTRPYYAESWRSANPDCQLPLLFPSAVGPITPAAANLHLDDTTPTSTKTTEEKRNPNEEHYVRLRQKYDNTRKTSRRKLRYTPVGEKPKLESGGEGKENRSPNRPKPTFTHYHFSPITPIKQDDKEKNDNDQKMDGDDDNIVFKEQVNNMSQAALDLTTKTKAEVYRSDTDDTSSPSEISQDEAEYLPAPKPAHIEADSTTRKHCKMGSIPHRCQHDRSNMFPHFIM